MKDNTSVLEADLEYAERMVRHGYATAEQAARTCGIKLTDLNERLVQPPRVLGQGRNPHALLPD